jgi:hypothetical protein
MYTSFFKKNDIFKDIFREENGDFSSASRERDVTEANELSWEYVVSNDAITITQLSLNILITSCWCPMWSSSA